jgi:hypothetical protein
VGKAAKEVFPSGIGVGKVGLAPLFLPFSRTDKRTPVFLKHLSAFSLFSLSLLAYVPEYNYVAPGIMMVGIGPIWKEFLERKKEQPPV